MKKNTNRFENYVSDFKVINDISIDSISLSRIIKNNPYESIDSLDHTFIRSIRVNKSCENNKMYLFYKVGRLETTENEIVLIYYLKLNENCQYDGYENLFILCKYEDSGDLLSEHVIGKYYQVFGENEYIYFQKLDSNKLELTKYYEYESDTNGIISSTKIELLFF